jgi:hypothetical protein
LSHLADPDVQPGGAAVLSLTTSPVGTEVLSFSGRTLYVPGPDTRPGGNELIILELHAASAAVAFHPGPDLGHTDL